MVTFVDVIFIGWAFSKYILERAKFDIDYRCHIINSILKTFLLMEFDLLHIFVDADACPVKNEIYRVAERYHLSVTLVTNSWMRSPPYSWVKLQVVGDGLDEADNWIVEHVLQDDVVVTADIPLASRSIKNGAAVIGTTGKPFTEDNVGAALAMRDLMKELRDAGAVTGGPPPLTQRDRSRFLQEFDTMIQAIRRRCGAGSSGSAGR